VDFLELKSQIPSSRSQRIPNLPKIQMAGTDLGNWDLGVRWNLGFGTWDLLLYL
jgi:hypothetical protein